MRIDVTLPGHEFVVNRSPEEAHQHENLHVAIRDAFDAMRRQIEDVVGKSISVKSWPDTTSSKFQILLAPVGEMSKKKAAKKPAHMASAASPWNTSFKPILR